MKQTADIIRRSFRQYRPAIAYSGGGDSTVLLDIVARMGYRPPLIYVDTQMEYEDALPFIRSVAKKYGMQLHVTKAKVTPAECWKKYGYPMLGKQSARIWMQSHRGHKSLGFRCDCSTCCRTMKLAPGRSKVREIGCNASLTGLRGEADSRIRGLRAIKDGAIHFLEADKITQVNPLHGWTDLMIARYTKQNGIPVEPKKQAGHVTSGCMFCGGGAQFDNSGFRVLRRIRPEAWRRMIVDLEFGPVILAIKYDMPLSMTNEAINRLGGLATVADRMPHVFDFLRINPLKGYDR
jgi:3'-phosphoadenosine 5'-phosphosulfate sulfotransferase (PAPS reductase)/FAD synthetase